MVEKNFNITSLCVSPVHISLYVPPIVWKGDCVGHIGGSDTFFWVLEGECFLMIDDESYIIRSGQLAYLPKGKKRTYTHNSQHFCMYEMSFDATSGEYDLMDILGLREGNYVVDVPDIELMNALFENSHRRELYKEPVYDVDWCSNILKIIKIYFDKRKKLSEEKGLLFAPVISYMNEHIGEIIRTEELAALVYMQQTNFIRRFKSVYGMPPMTYLGRLRIYRAMTLLITEAASVEEIASRVGIHDTSYFSRIFKSACKVSPTEYRRVFKRVL